MAKSSLNTANHIPKSLSTDDSNHSEDLRQSQNHKMSVKSSGSSRVTQDLQVTSHEIKPPKFTFHGK